MGKKDVTSESRRDFIKKASYVAPAIMTVAVVPSVHAIGSSATSSDQNTTPPPVGGI